MPSRSSPPRLSSPLWQSAQYRVTSLLTAARSSRAFGEGGPCGGVWDQFQPTDPPARRRADAHQRADVPDRRIRKTPERNRAGAADQMLVYAHPTRRQGGPVRLDAQLLSPALLAFRGEEAFDLPA